MKIGIYLVDLLPTEGGGFSYFEKLMHAIDRHSFDPRLEVCFVGRVSAQKSRITKPFCKLSPDFFYRIFYILNKLYILKFLSKIFRTNLDLCNRVDISRLKEQGVDVVLYPQQNHRYVDRFPFISMNWDIGHKSTYAFPEMIDNGSFEARENWYTREIQKALAIFTESEHGKKELSRYFSIPEKKIHVVPLFPGNVTGLTMEENVQQEILSKYGIRRLGYFYYPAQFWAHKNHYNLLLAFNKLKKNDPSQQSLKLVFTGSDKGNKEYIRSVIRKYQLEKDVVLLDFVSLEEVNVLYRNAIALVMPTFLGPTNMPLLEAQALGVPVICSDFDGHREICGDAALYVDPANADSITQAMRTYLDSATRDRYIARSADVLKHSVFTIHHAIAALEQALIALEPVRKTFA